MASEGPPSRYPPSMGPGARPVNKPGDSERSKLLEVMQARSKYKVSVEPETLSLSYELNNSPRLYRLSFDNMPLHGLSRWWIYGGSMRARRAGVLAIDLIRGSENVVQRPVTQQEAEALAYWTSRRLLYGSLATFATSAFGFYLAHRGRAKMKFPFVSAKPLERYTKFPLQRFPVITGQLAQTAWQVTRYVIWMELCFLVGTPVIGALGSFSAATGMATDPRTQGLIQAMRERGRGDMNRTLSNIPAEWPQQPQGQDSSRDAQSDSQSYYQGVEGGGSPDGTVADRNHEGDSLYQSVASDTGVFDDSRLRDRERKQQQGYPKPQPSGQMQENTSSTSSADPDPFFFDDASPTAGNDPDMATPSGYRRSQGGSAWERIRRSNSPSSAGSSTATSNADFRRQRLETERAREAREARANQLAERDSGSNESVSYGSGRDGRAREQAQREFDEMLERERIQSGSDEYDRGMAAVESREERRTGEGTSAWERRRGGD
ncbi:uncharacterized protein Z520_00620 [Fonsecaea multimorphosa CBS 102226]|uniref:Uncharacterized protein n=1 Tax=Fonsecaea multimorphosa CBS 102226 TaxID=1442371 RepID=A0A0D2KCT9_9EURO|nr:uncharacterized protein Z520_00620 [Fonsecaea multimorphosa CBS 102226]KIY03928.1 hypothetical protein Z520_00620 [Fonsecaea multimorphosa CBS 102226]OAL31769.1 hypothetical protein AYO22_00639 [Fonsecaea multimorphosa]